MPPVGTESPRTEPAPRTRSQAIGTGDRIMRTVERPAHVAKNRLNLPDEMPLDWDAYAQHLTNGSSPSLQGAKSKGAK